MRERGRDEQRRGRKRGKKGGRGRAYWPKLNVCFRFFPSLSWGHSPNTGFKSYLKYFPLVLSTFLLFICQVSSCVYLYPIFHSVFIGIRAHVAHTGLQTAGPPSSTSQELGSQMYTPTPGCTPTLRCPFPSLLHCITACYLYTEWVKHEQDSKSQKNGTEKGHCPHSHDHPCSLSG